MSIAIGCSPCILMCRWTARSLLCSLFLWQSRGQSFHRPSLLCRGHLPSGVQENSHATAIITQLDLEKSQLQRAQAAKPSHSSSPRAEAGQAGVFALEGLKLDLQQERARREQVSLLPGWLSCCRVLRPSEAMHICRSGPAPPTDAFGR